MKNLYKILILGFILLPISASAQPHGAQHRNQKEAIQAEKIAFYSDYLELTPQEAEKFWPVYNAFWKQRSTAHRNLRMAVKKLQNSLAITPKVPDTEIQALTDNIIELSKKENEVFSNMIRAMQNVIPIRKAAKLISAEEEFRNQLIRQLKDKN